MLREAGLAADAGDVVSDAMVSIMSSPPKNVRNWEAFLVTAVKRKALDRLTSAAVRHAGPELKEAHLQIPDDANIAQDVAEDIDRQREAATVWDCLSILDERHRKVVWEMVALERARGDVARELGVSPARVSQMVSRALQMLRAEFLRRQGK